MTAVTTAHRSAEARVYVVLAEVEVAATGSRLAAGRKIGIVAVRGDDGAEVLGTPQVKRDASGVRPAVVDFKVQAAILAGADAEEASLIAGFGPLCDYVSHLAVPPVHDGLADEVGQSDAKRTGTGGESVGFGSIQFVSRQAGDDPLSKRLGSPVAHVAVNLRALAETALDHGSVYRHTACFHLLQSESRYLVALLSFAIEAPDAGSSRVASRRKGEGLYIVKALRVLVRSDRTPRRAIPEKESLLCLAGIGRRGAVLRESEGQRRLAGARRGSHETTPLPPPAITDQLFDALFLPSPKLAWRGHASALLREDVDGARRGEGVTGSRAGLASERGHDSAEGSEPGEMHEGAGRGHAALACSHRCLRAPDATCIATSTSYETPATPRSEAACTSAGQCATGTERRRFISEAVEGFTLSARATSAGPPNAAKRSVTVNMQRVYTAGGRNAT